MLRVRAEFAGVSRAGAAALVTVVAAGVLAGCGSSAASVHGSPVDSSSARTSAAPLRPACQSAEFSMAVGAELRLSRCGAGTYADISSGTALVASGPLTFTAVAPGSAVVEISSGPVCSPGVMCSQLRVRRAILHVTVH